MFNSHITVVTVYISLVVYGNCLHSGTRVFAYDIINNNKCQVIDDHTAKISNSEQESIKQDTYWEISRTNIT